MLSTPRNSKLNMCLISNFRKVKLNRVKFRRVSIRDLDEITKLEREIFGPSGYSRNIVEYLLYYADFFVAACINDSIVGYICGEIRLGRGHIISIAVKKEFRRRGIGSMLLKLFIEELRKKNVRTVYLEVSTENKGAIKFYRKHGFRITGFIPKYYSDGSDAFIMEMDLVSGGGVSSHSQEGAVSSSTIKLN